VKLSDLIQALHKDDDMRKLAQGAAGGETESPVSEQVGSTIEDEKAKVQTRLMELAGLQEEGESAANDDENLNEAQKAPAGEKAVAPGVSPAASAAAPEEMATVLASAIGKMPKDQQKLAWKAVIQKCAAANVLGKGDLAGEKKAEKDAEKVAQEQVAEADAIGRIMARAFHDETTKIAAEIEAAAKAEAPAAEKKAAAEVTDGDLAFLKEIFG
jgi:ethanolamine utilization cobalamin adenosyltransferase